ncbi:MAG: HD domain-containing protein [Thermodesulfobacteriota bacterium]
MINKREIRDPIHGFICRSDLEQLLIDTSVMQRLRGIRQLALANLVYPGALHTRFDHSLGVMHIAGKLAERLIHDQETQELIRLAGLLHDIGHGPFSHVSESILEKFNASGLAQIGKKDFHEQLTIDIIEKCPDIRRILGDPKLEKIINLLCGGGEGIEKGIISGSLDADKQDYLLRDSYFCGVKYGVFDSDRLIHTLQSWPDRYENLIAASKDGVYAIEQFVIAKYHMSTQVYRHKIRLITDAMIERALELGIIEDKLQWLKDLFIYKGTNEYIQNFLKWDDARVTTALLYPLGTSGKATELFFRLKERHLFKVVFSKHLLEITDANVRSRLADLEKYPDIKLRIEQDLAEYLSKESEQTIAPHHVVVKQFTIKSIREQSRNNEGSILIITDDGPRNFEEISTLFKSIDEKQNDASIEVYAPVTFSDLVIKRRKLAEFAQSIHDKIVTIVTSEIQKEKGKGAADEC